MLRKSLIFMVALGCCSAAGFAADSVTQAVGLPSAPATNGDAAVEATLLFYADRGMFEVANPGLPVEDFEEGMVAPGGVLGCDAPIDSSTNNACFVPGDILPGVSFSDDPGPDAGGLLLLGAGFNGNPSISFGSNTFTDQTVIDFNPPVLAAGMDLQCHYSADTVDVEIFGTGAVSLGVFQSGCTNDGTFFGVRAMSGLAIERITVYSPTNQVELMDDLTFGSPTPTLATFANRANFDIANPGLPIEDFEEGMVAPGGVLGCDAPIDNSTNNACFVPGDILPGVIFSDDPGPDVDGLLLLGAGFNGNPSISFGTNTYNDKTVIEFNPPVPAAGMDLQCHFSADTVDVEIYGTGGVPLAAFQSNCPNEGAFFGVSAMSGIEIERIVLFSPTNQVELLDDLAFGVPVHPMGFTTYDNRATFDLVNPGLPIEDFEEGMVAPAGLVTCDPPVNSFSNDACFVPGDILTGISFEDGPGPDPLDVIILGPGFNGNPSVTLLSNTFTDEFVINFGPPVRSVGMDLQCHFGATDVDVHVFGDGGVFLGTAVSACTNGGTFLGIKSTSPEDIEQIRIVDPLGSVAEGVDDIAFGTSTQIFVDGFESGDTSEWSNTGP